MKLNASAKNSQRLAFAIPLLLLGGAYISQFGFGLYPCEMCWWQRWPHFAALGLAALSFVVPGLSLRKILIGLAAVGIMVSGLIGGFHAGVEYDWWEGITGCAVMPSTQEGVSAMDAVLNTPLIRCDVAPWDLFGISLAGWNFLISVGSSVVILALLFRSNGQRNEGVS